MKRSLVIGCLFALVLLAVNPRGAQACSRCNPAAPQCEAANWRMCQLRQLSATTYLCSDTFSECAWVYAAAEIGADGSLAGALDADPRSVVESAGELRGCHGLVVARAATVQRAAAVRRASSRIII